MSTFTKTKGKAIESLASSVTHLDDSIKDGLILLTQSFSQNDNLPPPMENSFSSSSI